jgi:hypothetical protein
MEFPTAPIPHLKIGSVIVREFEGKIQEVIVAPGSHPRILQSVGVIIGREKGAQLDAI